MIHDRKAGLIDSKKLMSEGPVWELCWVLEIPTMNRGANPYADQPLTNYLSSGLTPNYRLTYHLKPTII